MTLDKAIERLELFIELHPSAGYAGLKPAIQLSIGALKREGKRRRFAIPPKADLLPGETLD